MKTLLALVALAALPTSASAQSASGSAGQITVPFNANYGAEDYWCAAGKYVARLGAAGNARIYVTSPLPRPRGEGMTFSLTGPASGHSDGFASLLLSRADVLRAFHARAQCGHKSFGNSERATPRNGGGGGGTPVRPGPQE